MSDPDAVTLYNCLRKILKHFSVSTKSTELLNNALNILEQNKIHMLVWGGTRMAGFLDGCKQSSSILIPFLDTLTAGKTREEEAAYILSAKGVFTLELFADLHIFANQYLHCIDSDKILSCEVYNVARSIASKLVRNNISTLKADKIHNNLFLDENKNVMITLDDPLGGSHTQLLKEKISRNNTLSSIKDGLLTTKKQILKRLHNNIVDQTGTESIYNLLNVFDLTSQESKDEKEKNKTALRVIRKRDHT